MDWKVEDMMGGMFSSVMDGESPRSRLRLPFLFFEG